MQCRSLYQSKLGQCKSLYLWYKHADQNIPDHDNFCVTRNVKHKNLIKIRNSNIYYIIRTPDISDICHIFFSKLIQI